MLATAGALLALGIPSAVIPNPIFIRMIPTEPVNVAVWLASAPLIGLIVATYLGRRDAHAGPATGGEQMQVGAAGIAAYLAIACPICNALVVAALGTSGALALFAPLQPVIGLASVALLAGVLAWRLRRIAAGCERCS
jgi:hypothetical protein